MIALAAVCFMWAGMVLGISFLDTPVKFMVPSVTMPVALDLGRHVFGTFNKVEVGWALLACGLLVAARARRSTWIPLGAAIAALMLQTFWLLPAMNARIVEILNGHMPPDAPYHIVYVVLELLKLACLATAGTTCLRGLKRAAPAA